MNVAQDATDQVVPIPFRPAPNAWEGIEGFMAPEECTELQRLACGRRVLEIGIWKGRSTIAMAATAQYILAVDHFRGDAFAGRANTCHTAWTNLCETGARDRVILLVGPFDVLRELNINLRDFDLIHYDADHTYEATVDALQLLSTGAPSHATLAIHDYDDNPNHAGVKRAVNEFVAQSGMQLRTVRRLAILEPAAA